MATISITEVNQMTYDDFLLRFGNIVQAAKWITASLWSLRPFGSVVELHQRVCDILDSLPLAGIRVLCPLFLHVQEEWSERMHEHNFIQSYSNSISNKEQ